MDKYLNILVDSLNKKNEILDNIRDVITAHEKCVAAENFDIDEYNFLMEEKGRLIDKMNQLDDGFTALYARVAPALRDNPVDYTDKIKSMQEMITQISDKIALIQAREMRVHAAVERIIASGPPSSGHSVTKADAAMKYYKTMQKTTVTRSVFMDKKK